MSLPNRLTVFRLILTPGFVVTLFLEDIYFRYLSVLVFLIASLTDWYDGYIARKFNNITLWGRFLDPLADKILVSSAFISFVILGYVKTWMAAVIILRDFIITGLRSYSFLKGEPLVTNSLAKFKTFSQMGAIFLILVLLHVQRPSKGEETLGLEKMLIEKFVLFVTLLTAASGLVYLIENRRHLKNLAVKFYRGFLPSDY